MPGIAFITKQIQSLRWATHIKPALLDVSALACIYFLPALSHMFGIKLYLLEPMRLMLVLALVHTHRKNAFLLALTLPLFSFVVSAHPVFLKSLLIAAELTVNVALFYLLLKRLPTFIAIFGAIWMSKLFYYGLKYVGILLVWPGDSLVGTPLPLQLLTSLIFSSYLWLMLRKDPRSD